MRTCDKCGGEIEFRYMGGFPTPIHINGGCSGYRSGAHRLSGPGAFRTVESYVNPNAICPECRKTVFFYQSPYGGRVFFDDLGWPWPKHSCTDNPAAQTGEVGNYRASTSLGSVALRDSEGMSLDVYDIDEMLQDGRGWIMKFRRIRRGPTFRVSMSNKQMRDAKLKEADFREAPSFVVAPTIPGRPTRRVQFICARLKRIVTLELAKV